MASLLLQKHKIVLNVLEIEVWNKILQSWVLAHLCPQGVEIDFFDAFEAFYDLVQVIREVVEVAEGVVESSDGEMEPTLLDEEVNIESRSINLKIVKKKKKNEEKKEQICYHFC